MPDKTRSKWVRPFNWPPSTWEFTPGMQKASEVALAFGFLLIMLTIGSAAILWPILLLKTFQYVVNGTADDVRNSLLAVAALVGVPFLIWRTLIASKQTNISREGHYTALFTKAVEQLGADKVVKRREFKPKYKLDAEGEILRDQHEKPIADVGVDGKPEGEYQTYEVSVKNYEVRLGAIYALERIAQDSDRDAWPIYLTLCAYAQNNADQKRGDKEKKADGANHSDIEEVFNVVSRYRGPFDTETSSLFQGIHIPDLWLRGNSIRNIVIRNCSSEEFAINADVQSVSLRESVLKKLVLMRNYIDGLCVAECDVGLLAFERSNGINIDVTDSHLTEFKIMDSKIENSMFSLSTARLAVVSNVFKECDFRDYDRFVHGPKGNTITDNSFENCNFIGCDFSLDDLSENTFTNCRFMKCNLIATTAINGIGNDFKLCMTDDDYVPSSSSDALLALRKQWVEWKYKDEKDLVGL